MFKYAQINNEDVVEAISYLHSEVIMANMVRTDDPDAIIGSTYNRETGEFTPPEPQPEPEPKASIEEIAEETLLETKYQTFILEMMM